MKYAIIGKVAPEMMEDTKSFEFFIRDLIREETKDLSRGSKRLMNIKLQITQHADDYLYNRLTVRIVGNVYKLSRIIKRKAEIQSISNSYQRDKLYRWFKKKLYK